MPAIISFPRRGPPCMVLGTPVVLTLSPMSLEDDVAGFRFAMLSHVGRVRAGNEDFCAATPEHGAFIVCDGMGGAAAGEVASQLAATTFLEHLSASLPERGEREPLLHRAVEMANARVRQHARTEPKLRGMGTTLVALLLERAVKDQDRGLWLVHVGDSRCYRLRAGELEPLTQDHSLVQEQIMAGQMTAEQAERSPIRNIITRAIGSAPRVQAEIRRVTPETGDVYLLASDGLTRELSDKALARRLRKAPEDLEGTCAALVEAANAAGGRDNITVLLLRIEA